MAQKTPLPAKTVMYADRWNGTWFIEMENFRSQLMTDYHLRFLITGFLRLKRQWLFLLIVNKSNGFYFLKVATLNYAPSATLNKSFIIPKSQKMLKTLVDKTFKKDVLLQDPTLNHLRYGDFSHILKKKTEIQLKAWHFLKSYSLVKKNYHYALFPNKTRKHLKLKIPRYKFAFNVKNYFNLETLRDKHSFSDCLNYLAPALKNFVTVSPGFLVKVNTIKDYTPTLIWPTKLMQQRRYLATSTKKVAKIGIKKLTTAPIKTFITTFTKKAVKAPVKKFNTILAKKVAKIGIKKLTTTPIKKFVKFFAAKTLYNSNNGGKFHNQLKHKLTMRNSYQDRSFIRKNSSIYQTLNQLAGYHYSRMYRYKRHERIRAAVKTLLKRFGFKLKFKHLRKRLATSVLFLGRAINRVVKLRLFFSYVPMQWYNKDYYPIKKFLVFERFGSQKYFVSSFSVLHLAMSRGSGVLLTDLLVRKLRKADNHTHFLNCVEKICRYFIADFTNNQPHKYSVCKGIEILFKGKLNGGDRAKAWRFKLGPVHSSTFYTNTREEHAKCMTRYGMFHIRVRLKLGLLSIISYNVKSLFY
jgi:hypothetical protein